MQVHNQKFFKAGEFIEELTHLSTSSFTEELINLRFALSQQFLPRLLRIRSRRYLFCQEEVSITWLVGWLVGWLVKKNSFLTGDFIFMLNTDWMAKKQLNVNLINHFYKQQKNIQKKSELYKLTDLI